MAESSDLQQLDWIRAFFMRRGYGVIGEVKAVGRTDLCLARLSLNRAIGQAFCKKPFDDPPTTKVSVNTQRVLTAVYRRFCV